MKWKVRQPKNHKEWVRCWVTDNSLRAFWPVTTYYVQIISRSDARRRISFYTMHLFEFKLQHPALWMISSVFDCAKCFYCSFSSCGNDPRPQAVALKRFYSISLHVRVNVAFIRFRIRLWILLSSEASPHMCGWSSAFYHLDVLFLQFIGKVHFKSPFLRHVSTVCLNQLTNIWEDGK